MSRASCIQSLLDSLTPSNPLILLLQMEDWGLASQHYFSTGDPHWTRRVPYFLKCGCFITPISELCKFSCSLAHSPVTWRWRIFPDTIHWNICNNFTAGNHLSLKTLFLIIIHWGSDHDCSSIYRSEISTLVMASTLVNVYSGIVRIQHTSPVTSTTLWIYFSPTSCHCGISLSDISQTIFKII